MDPTEQFYIKFGALKHVWESFSNHSQICKNYVLKILMKHSPTLTSFLIREMKETERNIYIQKYPKLMVLYQTGWMIANFPELAIRHDFNYVEENHPAILANFRMNKPVKFHTYKFLNFMKEAWDQFKHGDST